jgi:hypothetical protein
VCTDTSFPYGQCSERASSATTTTSCDYWTWERQAGSSNLPYTVDPSVSGKGENAVLKVRGPALVRVVNFGPGRGSASSKDHLYIKLHAGAQHGCQDTTNDYNPLKGSVGVFRGEGRYYVQQLIRGNDWSDVRVHRKQHSKGTPNIQNSGTQRGHWPSDLEVPIGHELELFWMSDHIYNTNSEDSNFKVQIRPPGCEAPLSAMNGLPSGPTSGSHSGWCGSASSGSNPVTTRT